MAERKQFKRPGIVQRIGSGLAWIAKRAGVSLGDETVNWRRFFGIPYRGDRGPNTRTVSAVDALTVDSFYQALRVRSEAFSDCPITLFERGPNGPREALSHPTCQRLMIGPSIDHTRGNFWKLMAFWVGWRGNAFASISRDPVTDQWLNLTPMFPDWVRPHLSKDTGEPCWIYRQPGKPQVELAPRDVFHLMGPSVDGRMGDDPVARNQRLFAQILSLGDYQLDYFERGHALTGVVKFPQPLDDDARENWDKTLSDFQEGGRKRNGILTLEDGGDFVGINNDPEKTQLNATDSALIQKISRITGVPLSFLMVPGSSYQTAEQEDIRLIKYSLTPLFTNATEEIARKLLTPAEQDRFYAKAKTGPLEKADSLTRARVKALEANWGKTLVNEWRADDDLASIPGGDIPMRPGNMVAVGVNVNPGSAPAAQPGVVQDPGQIDPAGAQP